MKNLKYKLLLGVLMTICSSAVFAQSFEEAETQDRYFKILDVPIPEGIFLEVGGMVTLPNGNIAICTRRGEVWIVSNTENLRPTFKRFARGLHEPLGIAYKDGDLYVSQRGELTRLIDNDNDGVADYYEKVASWPLSANYHEYSYGPALLPNGNFMLTFNLGWIDRLGRMESPVPWRGWVVEITPEGEIVPFATGLRSPAGYWINDRGDFFYSENQGDWVGSGRVSHVEKGDFLGNPKGLIWGAQSGIPALNIEPEKIPDTGEPMVKVAKEVPALKLPAVWLPHGIMGSSTSGFLYDDTEGKFGPFSGHVFIGDQNQSTIMRMDLELVEGEYQGALFPFLEGFSSGVFRMVWGNDASMLVGMTNRGWSSVGKESFGLQKVIWTGKIPFEMKTIRVAEEGFRIEFTMPFDRKRASNPDAYEVTSFNYMYQSKYGSPVIDKINCPVRSVRVLEDGKSVLLEIDSLRPGYIHEIKVHDVNSAAGKSLLHHVGYYTLNQIPMKTNLTFSSHENVESARPQSSIVNEINPEISLQKTTKMEPPVLVAREKFNKREITIPSSWNGQIDRTIKISTKPGMKFDLENIVLKAGSKVKLIFQNSDDMLHNLLIVSPGTASEVGELAMKLGLDGHRMNYVPKSDNVLHYTHLLEPHSSETIYFHAPEKPDDYSFVCTVPGHYLSMRGILKVIK